MTKRILKKISTPFERVNPTAAVVMVNLVDPQVNTIKVFLEAVEQRGMPFFIVGNKVDLVDSARIIEVRNELGTDFVPASMLTHEGLGKVKSRIGEFKPGSRIIILGIFNSGKSSLINALTGLGLKIGDLPGTTLSFEEYEYGDYNLIDTVGQITDVSKPLMVSVDLSKCRTADERIRTVMEEGAEGILASIDGAVPDIKRVVDVLKKQIDSGYKIVVTGAGASALVAMAMGGQGIETGIPILVFTNNFADAQPISFAKGTGEEEAALSRYAASCVNEGDCVIAISASGGSGFVYHTLALAREKGAITIAITENPDTPLGKNADYVIKSSSKPEGPSTSKIMVAHLVIVHALLLTLAEERGITADQSIGYMLPEHIPSKKMGIK